MATAYTTLLGLALPVTGELNGTWGTVVNDSITELVEDAIAGSATASVTSADWTLTTTGSGAANQARSAILIPTGTPGVSRNIIAPSSSKAYIVDNQSNAAVVIKGAATTGVTIATNTAALVAWDGADFVAVGQNLTLGANVATFLATPSSANLAAAVTDETGSGALVFATSPTLVTPILGTPQSGTLTNATGLPIDAGTTGTLPVGRGGTGATTLTANNVLLGNGTSALQVVAPGTSGNVLTSNGTTWTSAAGGAALSGETQSVSPFETFLGSGAGAVNTGINNTFIGFQAGNDNTTGTDNTALGYQALDVNTAGSFNVAIGSGAMNANTTGVSNVAMGTNALYSNTTGANNVAMGVAALGANTTGVSNVAMGTNALYSNTTGIQNVAVGRLALSANTTGSRNIALGYQALDANTNASNNIAIGVDTLGSNTTGFSNVAVGDSALRFNTTASSNTAFGDFVLASNTTGANNTAVGYRTLSANTTGTSNVAVGYNALTLNTIGIQNTAVGSGALDSNTTGNNNTAVGDGALDSNTTGSQNVAMGASALGLSTTASNNVALGFNALDANTTGTQNVAVGKDAGDKITTGTQNVVIGESAASSGTNDLTTGSNNIIVGHNAAASSATVSNEITLGNSSISALRCQITTISSLSDARDKTNISDLPAGLEFINALRPVEFDWNMRDGGKVGIHDTGFIAQDLLSAQQSTGVSIPDLVRTIDPERLEAGYGKLLPVLVKAIQELSEQVEALKAEVNQLKGV